MTNKEKKKQAISLRLQSMSLGEIANVLKISKGTASVWLRDVILTEEQVNEINSKGNIKRSTNENIGQSSHERSVLRREKWQSIGKERAIADSEFAIICAIYWGEGKKVGSAFSVANADPQLINLVFRWCVQEGYIEKIKFSVIYHAQNGIEESEIKKWWFAKVNGLCDKHLNKFTVKTTCNPKNIGKLPYGTGYLDICSVDLKHMVIGGIQSLIQRF